MQLGEQAETIGTQGRIVGIDHDAIEEGINRSTQRREGLQRLGVVAGDEGSVGLRHDIDERVVQGDFGSFLEQGVIDRRLDRVLDLFQDVADPLVGGGQRGGFRQCGKRHERRPGVWECRRGAAAAG